VLVASLPHAPARIVGVAQFAGAVEAGSSEIAVVVSDAWQYLGLGCHLLDALMNVAIAAGVERLYADMLADNYAMRRLAQKLGFEIAVNQTETFLVRASKNLPMRRAAPVRSSNLHGTGAAGRPVFSA
jgi:acetyltransferase